MKKKPFETCGSEVCNIEQDIDPTEYVILRTVQMNNNNNSNNNDNVNSQTITNSTDNSNSSSQNSSKIDNLSQLLQESESVTKFRRFLDSINRGHYLDFWFACQGFRNFDNTDTHKLYQLTKVIYRAYIRSESIYAVPLELSTKRCIVDKLADRNSQGDQMIFDRAQEEIRAILSGDLLKEFLASNFHKEDGTSITGNSNITKTTSSETMTTIVTTCSVLPSNSNITSKPPQLHTSHSSDAIIDLTNQSCSTSAQQQQHYVVSGCPAPLSTGYNNNNNSVLMKDRKNLSEVDPSSFVKLLNKKLEEVQNEQSNYERLMSRLMHNNSKKLQSCGGSGLTESDTDDSSNYSAINYLLRYQLQGLPTRRVIYPPDNDEDDDDDDDVDIVNDDDDDNEVETIDRKDNNNNNNGQHHHHYLQQFQNTQFPPHYHRHKLSATTTTTSTKTTIKSEDQIAKCFTIQAQDILDSHCSRIGLEDNSGTNNNNNQQSPHINQKHRHHHSHHHHHHHHHSHYSRRRLSHSRDRALLVGSESKSGSSASRKKRDNDLGSTTSYDSGVATSSLEQYSSLGMSGSIVMLDHNPGLPPRPPAAVAASTALVPTLPLTTNNQPTSPILYPQSHQSASSLYMSRIGMTTGATNYHHHPHHHHPTSRFGSPPPIPTTATSYWSSTSINTAANITRNVVVPPSSSNITSSINPLIGAAPISSSSSSILDNYTDPTRIFQLQPNAISDVSSNFDSGISSAYEHLGRKPNTLDDKVHRWIIKHPEWSTNQDIEEESGTIKPNFQANKQQQQQQHTIHPNTPQIPPRINHLQNRSIKIEDDTNSTNPNNRPIKNDEDQVHLTNQNNSTLVIGYYIGNDPVPYRTQVPLDTVTNSEGSLTLAQFKNIVAKKGNFRYFFKRYCNEFECGLVHEEISEDDAILPLWEGKIVAKIERID